jgi:1,4-alpha-glucan branching enzyme
VNTPPYQCETSPGAFSARTSLDPVNFHCRAPQAKSVALTVDFNHWRPVAMRQSADGWWHLQVELPPGHHQYRFLVDGTPTLDPHAMGVGRNEANETVSIIALS